MDKKLFFILVLLTAIVFSPIAVAAPGHGDGNGPGHKGDGHAFGPGHGHGSDVPDVYKIHSVRWLVKHGYIDCKDCPTCPGCPGDILGAKYLESQGSGCQTCGTGSGYTCDCSDKNVDCEKCPGCPSCKDKDADGSYSCDCSDPNIDCEKCPGCPLCKDTGGDGSEIIEE
jgi:hypothetical protein